MFDRELVRRIVSYRKQAGLPPTDYQPGDSIFLPEKFTTGTDSIFCHRKRQRCGEDLQFGNGHEEESWWVEEESGEP